MFGWRNRKPEAPAVLASTGPAPTELQNAPVRVVAAPAFPRGVAVLLGLAAAVVIAYGLATLKGIVAPVMLALVLTICVHPLRARLERRGVPRGVVTGSVLATVFVLVASFIGALLLALAQFATILPTFSAQVEEIGAGLSDWLVSIGIGT